VSASLVVALIWLIWPVWPFRRNPARRSGDVLEAA
jgi:hypothetical protein